MNNKGMITGIVIIIVSVVVILIALAVFFSTAFREERTTGRYLFEASLLSESDKVETYVRSYQRAMDLSLVQALHSAGTGHVVLQNDYFSIYSRELKIPYWRVYDSYYIPDTLSAFKEKMGTIIIRVVSSLMTDYLNQYKEFAASNNFDLTSSGSPDAIAYGIDDYETKVYGDYLSFLRSRSIIPIGEQEQDININRTFRPFAKLFTRFGRMLSRSFDLVRGSGLDFCANYFSNDPRICIESLASSLREPSNYIDVSLTIQSAHFDTNPENFYMTLKATFTDYYNNYTIYDYVSDRVDIKNISIVFMATVGKHVEYDPDQVVATRVSDGAEFQDCGASGIGIISKKPNICEFFRTLPKILAGCSEAEYPGPDLIGPAAGIEPGNPGITTDPIGSLPDTCKFNFTEELNNITEYYCLGQAGSVMGDSKFTCNDFCQKKYNSQDYTSYCLTTCPPASYGGFCFCKRCQLNGVTIPAQPKDLTHCFGGESPYCETGEKIQIAIDTPPSNQRADCFDANELWIDSFSNPECTFCSYDWSNENTCSEDGCTVRGLKAVRTATGWDATLPDYPLQCWDKVINVDNNKSFLMRDSSYYHNTPLLYGLTFNTRGEFTIASCLDSDRNPDLDKSSSGGITYGNTPDEPGTVTYLIRDDRGGLTTKELKDVCLNKYNLKEQFCNDHTPEYENINCNTFWKSNGADYGNCTTITTTNISYCKSCYNPGNCTSVACCPTYDCCQDGTCVATGSPCPTTTTTTTTTIP